MGGRGIFLDLLVENLLVLQFQLELTHDFLGHVAPPDEVFVFSLAQIEAHIVNGLCLFFKAEDARFDSAQGALEKGKNYIIAGNERFVPGSLELFGEILNELGIV